MKKVIALLVAMSTTAAFAGVDYASAYIFRGATVNDSAAIQPSMDTSVLGLDIGAWASYDTGADAFDEVDFFVGYDVTEIAGIAISVGLCEYIYTGEDADTGIPYEADTEASIYLDYSIAGVDLSAALNKTLDGAMGDYTIFGASYGFDISADIAGSISYEVGSLDDGTTDDEAYSAVTVAADIGAIGPLDVGIAYTTINEGDITDYVDEDDVFVVSISGDLF
jgi:uncharacterized protein (TIGR02001 family)